MICRTVLSFSWLLLASVHSATLPQQPLLQNPFDSSRRTTAAWAVLRYTVGERLIDVIPPAKPCYASNASESKDCIEAMNMKTNDIWTTDQAGGYFYSNWASCQASDETCAMGVNKSVIPPGSKCHQGSVPLRAINLTNLETLESDIKAAFRFANDSGVPLVIKNTGHDWKGRSTAPGSLALWTHHLQHPLVQPVVEQNFTPTGCPNLPACPTRSTDTVIHFGPGQQWDGAYEFADQQNLTVVGGTCGSVGIAGWLAGGGHSPITPVYGMGADNLREVEIITPGNGTIVANKYLNSDVFKAVRGGGGGTYGVVTKITYLAFEPHEVQDFRYAFPHLNETKMREYYNILTRNSVAWAKKGWGGYVMSNATHQYAALVNAKASLDDANQDMYELRDFVNKTWTYEKANKFTNTTQTFKSQVSWYAYIKEVMKPTNVHVGLWSSNPASRLVPKDVFERSESRKDLVEALMRLHNDKIVTWLMFVAPTAFDHTKDSALHPTWGTAVMSIRVNDRWDLFEENQKGNKSRTHFENVRRSFQGVRDLTKDMGMSISESDIWEQNHTDHFWGEDNYQELLRVKERTDPHNILSNWHAVKWDCKNPRYRCYPKP